MKTRVRIFLFVLVGAIFSAGGALYFRHHKKKTQAHRSPWAPMLAGEPKSALDLNKEPPDGSACLRAYSRLYANLEIRIYVVFGYKDARPARYVGDRYERLMLVQELLSPCRKGSVLCDFERSPDDGELFVKRIAGPDGKPRTVFINLMASAVSPDDDENRRDPFQSWQSQRTEAEFVRSLSDADVVLYNGHSRDGGGPDFSPPKLSGNRHVHYRWYQSSRPGLKLMSQALARGPQRMKLFGLFSCVSEKHFHRELAASTQKISVISQKELIYYADALRQIVGTLSALLAMWCETDFESAIQAESKGGFTKLEGFFKD